MILAVPLTLQRHLRKWSWAPGTHIHNTFLSQGGVNQEGFDLMTNLAASGQSSTIMIGLVLIPY